METKRRKQREENKEIKIQRRKQRNKNIERKTQAAGAESLVYSFIFILCLNLPAFPTIISFKL